MGIDIPPLEEYKRLGAHIQRCESKVMLAILSLIGPQEPVSVIWLHDGIYLHNTFDLHLAERLCSKGAQMAGFPHLVFKVTPEVPADVEDPEPSRSESMGESSTAGPLSEAFAPFKRRRIRVGF